MPADLKQLVLRTRRQTLRSNLCQAYKTLRDLPSLSLRLKDIKAELEAKKELLYQHAGTVRALSFELLHRDNVKSASLFIDDLIRIFSNWQEQLQKIQDSSFLAQVKSSGVNEWREELENLAEELDKSVQKNVKTWRDLTTIEATAREKVFCQSVELLGGIALRDARLNADVCELADELLRAMGELGPKHYAILGGLNNILMRLERIVRLPFPQWSVWDLPFAAHEFWHGSQQIREHGSRQITEKVRERAMRNLDGNLFPNGVSDTEVDKFLADALATNSVGPSFGYPSLL